MSHFYREAKHEEPMNVFNHTFRQITLSSMFLVCLCGVTVAADAPAVSMSTPVPRIERVVPLERDPAVEESFFREDFEKLSTLKDRFFDVAEGPGKFSISEADAFDGKKGLDQSYINRQTYDAPDKGSAGWVSRFFGDSPLFASRIEDKTQVTRIYARWYHKFEDGFDAVVDGKIHFPPKTARLRCQETGHRRIYTVHYWIDNESPEAFIAIERHTTAPGTHREWIPKSVTRFSCGDPENIGRWVHMELAVTLGDKPRSDHIQAWADGKLIADIPNDDLSAGWKKTGLTEMMWDAYWNGGSPKDQHRYYDALALSQTGPIGPARSGPNPELRLAAGNPKAEAFEVEVAEGAQKPLKPDTMYDGVPGTYHPLEIDCTVVWQGRVKGERRLTVDTKNGVFTGPRAGNVGLDDNALHFVRIRESLGGRWSAWSGWHAGFATVWKSGTGERPLPRGYLAR